MSHPHDQSNTFNILITTDNHVGYQETDPVRGDDSWKTFEEIMYIARDHDVDFVLQAGDLFHINKPTKKSMFHVMKSLRSVCFGDKPIEFELLSDPSLAIDNRGLNHANFQDPNMNISIPLFAIAGNHDDSTGDELLDPMDLLSVSGLINHFGKNLENDNVKVSPLLLQKGSTKLALYGLSNIRDERLYKTFLEGNVKFMRAGGAYKDSFFNLLAVHQNHTAHTDTSYLPESFLPNFLDFVVWGHEHECLPYTTPAPNGGVVLQPGSSVATSLSPGEMARKHVFILSVTGKNHSLRPIPLKTARPFKMKAVDLTATDIITGPGNQADVVRYLTEQIEGLIREAQDEWLELNREEEDDEEEMEPDLDQTLKKVPLPLVRLKVEYTDAYEIENPRRFSNRFVGQVANVNDVVLFHRKKMSRSAVVKKSKQGDEGVREDAQIKTADVTTLIDSFLKEDELNIISKNDINEAIKMFITQEDKNVLKDFVKLELEKDFEQLKKFEVNDNDEIMFNGDDREDSLKQMKSGFKEILKEISKERKLDLKAASQGGLGVGRSKAVSKKAVKSSELVVDSESDSGIDLKENLNTKPARPTRASRNRKPVKYNTDDLEIVSDDEYMEVVSDESNKQGDFMSEDEFVEQPAPRAVTKTSTSKLRKTATRSKKTAGSESVMDLVKKMARK